MYYSTLRLGVHFYFFFGGVGGGVGKINGA